MVSAGFSKVDITPRVGVELAGYGPFLDRRSTRVLEPLSARAMAVSAASGRWVIVSCDLMMIHAEVANSVRLRVSRSTGWSGRDVAVHATHTHSAPAAAPPCALPELTAWGSPDPLYVEVATRLIASACIEAIRDLQPARFYHATAKAEGFSYDRTSPSPGRTRVNALDGSWRTNRPETTDTSATVIRVERDGCPPGILAYFSCHPVVCGARNREIHGDFAGIAMNRVERRLPGAIAMFLQGAMGDIDPVYTHGPPRESLSALDRISTRFSDVVIDGLGQARPFDPAPVASRRVEVPYSVANPDRTQLKSMLKEYLRRVDGIGTSAPTEEQRLAMAYVIGIRRMLFRRRRARQPLLVHALRLGDLSFSGVNAELFNVIKRRHQKEFGSGALVLSETNGDLGYTPSRQAFESARRAMAADNPRRGFKGDEPPPPDYATTVAPLLGGLPAFTPNIEDEVVAGLQMATAALAS